jgi:hypothetical protein
MRRFAVCVPDYDDTEWHELDAIDEDDAAEKHAREVCGRDNECYEMFEGEGMLVLVRETPGRRTLARTVRCEMVPTFTARDGN